MSAIPSARPFIHDDFLLETKSARNLYHHHAENQPLIDYHCHLDPSEIAKDRRWKTITQIWLGGDHYKWRAMRAAGVPEEFCSGSAPDREKFRRFAAVLPRALRNPLYHWCHLELSRAFGIETLLGPDTADEIYDAANEVINRPEFSACGLLSKFNVKVVCTTDDPVDTLEHHRAIAADSSIRTLVLPTWRPDKAWAVGQPVTFVPWMKKLEAATDSAITSLTSMLQALRTRHDYFADHGCRLSDRGLEFVPEEECTQKEASEIFDKCRCGHLLSPLEARKFQSFLLHEFACWDDAKGWTMQIHAGAIRNNNSRAYSQQGPDTGYDSIGDFTMARGLSLHLDRLDAQGKLPKTILYNLNPGDNEVFASMAGNFQDGITPGKIQFGSGWWFLDQLDGMTRQIETLSQIGLLGHFVGMLTDSRSFLSYTRHEYFRRLLCNIIGADVERGLIPDDERLLGPLVQDICYRNARSYFVFPLKD
ncbi:MAG: glucuronate isomerase [bacterium]